MSKRASERVRDSSRSCTCAPLNAVSECKLLDQSVFLLSFIYRSFVLLSACTYIHKNLCLIAKCA